MKVPDPRVTDYALGELPAEARNELEKDLAGSDELRRELEDTSLLCEKLGRTRRAEGRLDDATRANLRKQCLRNARLVDRRRTFRRAAVAGTIAALAACLLAIPFGPWTTFLAWRQEHARRSEGVGRPLADAPVGPEPTVAQGGGSSSVPSSIPRSTPIAEPGATGEATVAAAPGPDRPMSSSVAGAKSEESAASGLSLRRDVAQFSGLAAPSADKVDEFRGRAPSPTGRFDTETYDAVEENRFLSARENPLSTFSIDVDTASYANVRRFLRDGALPPSGAVRVEELINYFPYDYPQPKSGEPFSVNVEINHPPWNPRHDLVRIGIKGREVSRAERPAGSLVFLVDVSGSMQDADKLPLLKRGLRSLVENLSPKDRVAIAVYAGSSGLVLPPTSGLDKQRILKALEDLESGGSTNGAEGIQLAYRVARENFIEEGINRVILCTDGDFNVGVTSQSELVSLIEKERSSGVYLSVLGFGRGNLKDSTMEKLADKGNGNYFYIDSPSEARKVLVDQLGGTIFTIAKDVKVQVEFNPALVAGYRLLGYENRLLAKEDFNDDRKDAGEIGSGHSVTALYEVVPVGQPWLGQGTVDPLKYQGQRVEPFHASNELLTVKLRYKEPDGNVSRLTQLPVEASAPQTFEEASRDFKFAVAVAGFGLKLRGSSLGDQISWENLRNIAAKSLGEDPGGHRAEFLTLIEKAKELTDSASPQRAFEE